ncbi:HAMP domain-containing protein [Candidatus Sumerlaeota bacterium]|nr:HAMP domain-containing protein [Candidatus Sumerlaeota bacterium]
MKRDKKTEHSGRLVRLSIVLPALLLLFTIGVGITNYQIAQFFLETSGNPRVQQALESTSMYILISSLIITVLALLVGVVITLSIIKPIKRMAQSASMVATGSLPPKVEIAISDEMRQLGSSFNQLIDYLQTLFEERDRYMLEAETGALILFDENRRIKGLNVSAERLLNVSSEEAEGKLLADISKKENSSLINLLIDILKNNTSFEIVRWTTPEGNKMVYSATLSVLQKKSMKHDEGCVLTSRDISALQSFYEALHRADVLAAIGALSTGLAHEIRNPLASIKSLAQLMSRRIEDKQKLTEYLRVMEEEIKKIDNVVAGIMEMSEPKAEPYERCDINRLLAEALIRTRHSKLAHKIRSVNIVEDYSMLPFVLLPPKSMVRAFYNILENALDATPANGNIRLKTRLIHKDHGKDSLIRIWISNTGSYVAEADKERIFQPFFTTKTDGKGLGLSITYQIITYNCGSIRVESNEQETVFIIEFPLDKIIAAEQD